LASPREKPRCAPSRSGIQRTWRPRSVCRRRRSPCDHCRPPRTVARRGSSRPRTRPDWSVSRWKRTAASASSPCQRRMLRCYSPRAWSRPWCCRVIRLAFRLAADGAACHRLDNSGVGLDPRRIEPADRLPAELRAQLTYPIDAFEIAAAQLLRASGDSSIHAAWIQRPREPFELSVPGGGGGETLWTAVAFESGELTPKQFVGLFAGTV